jgi:hypothetical protein
MGYNTKLADTKLAVFDQSWRPTYHNPLTGRPYVSYQKDSPTVVGEKDRKGRFRKKERVVVERVEGVIAAPDSVIVYGTTKKEAVILTLQSDGTFEFNPTEKKYKNGGALFW